MTTEMLILLNLFLVLSFSAFSQPTGGYYLTTLYASLYYITSFQPRLAARQLSVEAQNSLNQWHRRRTLHCNQSRRSQNRRTIRRQPCRDRNVQNSATKTEEESGKQSDSVSTDESQQQTESSTEALQPLAEETNRGGEDESQMSTPTSDCSQHEVMWNKQEDEPTLCTVGEEDQEGL